MCCEQLVCAHCSGRVAEGGCPTCRAARDSLHHRGGQWAGYAAPLALAVLLVVYVVLVVLAHR